VGTATGEFEVVQEQVHHHQPPPVEEICQFCQAVKWKDETANSCCRNGKGVLTRLHDPPQEFKQLFEDPLFVAKVRSYIIIIVFTFTGASLAENDRIDEQLGNAREGVCTFSVPETACHCVGTLLHIESRASSFAQLYVFDSDMEAPENMRRCIMDGLDREIVATVQRVKSRELIRRNVPASWRFYKKSGGSERSIGNSRIPGNRFANAESPNVQRGGRHFT